METESSSVFQSVIRLDLNTYKEYQKGISKTALSACILNLCLFFILVFYTGFMLIIHRGAEPSLQPFLPAGIYVLLTAITYFVARDGGSPYKALLLSNGDIPPTQQYSFCEDAIHVRSLDNDNKATFSYTAVNSWFETARFLVVVLKYQQCIVLDKTNLTGGTQEELIQWLKGKCPKFRRRATLPGSIIDWLKWIAVAGSLLAGLWLFAYNSGTFIPEGQITNSMTAGEMAEQLAAIGITGATEEIIAEVDTYYEDYGKDYGNRYSKVLDLLCWMGCGEYDYDALQWTPAQSGVYWFDSEVFNIQTMYTDFLRGVSALDPGELDFTDIQEDLSGVDPEEMVGTQAVTFSWKGESYRLEGTFIGDWFYPTTADDLSEIVRANTDKQLFFASDGGQGCLVFYADVQWAASFEALTGIKLFDDMSQAMADPGWF